MREIGEYLKKEREKRQISLRKVADETKIPIRYLEAMERGEVELIPGEVYLKGFLRSYAEEIGLDGGAVLERYRERTQPKDTEEQPSGAAELRGRKKPRRVSWHLRYERAFVFVLLLVLLIVAIIAAFRGGGGRRQDLPQPQPQVQQEPQASKEESAPRPEPAPKVLAQELEIFARDECWVEAYSQGKRLFALLLEPGESKQLSVRENVALLLGKPAVVRLKYGEEEVGGLGKETVTVVFDNEGNYNIYRGRREEEFYR